MENLDKYLLEIRMNTGDYHQIETEYPKVDMFDGEITEEDIILDLIMKRVHKTTDGIWVNSKYIASAQILTKNDVDQKPRTVIPF